MSHRLVEMVWSESKPRVLPLLLSLVYALVVRLNVDAWREQDQFFVERDPQLAYPAHPSTVSNTHLVLTGCVLPFVLIFGLAAWEGNGTWPDDRFPRGSWDANDAPDERRLIVRAALVAGLVRITVASFTVASQTVHMHFRSRAPSP